MSFAEGLAGSVMGMFGCGSFYDPMSQYEQQLAAAQSKLNATVQQGTLQMAVESEKSQVDSAKKLIATYEARTQAVIAKLWSE